MLRVGHGRDRAVSPPGPAWEGCELYRWGAGRLRAEGIAREEEPGEGICVGSIQRELVGTVQICDDQIWHLLAQEVQQGRRRCQEHDLHIPELSEWRCHPLTLGAVEDDDALGVTRGRGRSRNSAFRREQQRWPSCPARRPGACVARPSQSFSSSSLSRTSNTPVLPSSILRRASTRSPSSLDSSASKTSRVPSCTFACGSSRAA